MFVRLMTVGVAVLAWAAPATAQQRGTMEFGAFGSAASFDNSLSLKSGFGGGGRIGMFLNNRWSIEFEDAEMRASRPEPYADVNVGILSGRLVAVPFKAGAVSFLAGLGAGVSTETNFMHTYGVDALVGAKFPLNRDLALRVDGVWDWLANQDWQSYASVRVGLSYYRHGSHEIRTVTDTVTAAAFAQRPDSVSAAETRHLRATEASYRALRDSLGHYVPPSSAEALATMKEIIYFRNDRSDLSDTAKMILDEKVVVFRANPAMRIVIVGFASEPGTASYNMALGLRRAESAKAYLVSKGVEPIRIEIATRGEGQLVVEGPGEAADAANRRGQFRLLIADPYLAAPKH